MATLQMIAMRLLRFRGATIAGQYILDVSYRTRIRTILLYKYLSRWRRAGNFYVSLIIEFEKQHKEIVWQVEQGNITNNMQSRLKYEESKRIIAAIIRARKRLENRGLASTGVKLFYLNNHLTYEQKRKPYFAEETILHRN